MRPRPRGKTYWHRDTTRLTWTRNYVIPLLESQQGSIPALGAKNVKIVYFCDCVVSGPPFQPFSVQLERFTVSLDKTLFFGDWVTGQSAHGAIKKKNAVSLAFSVKHAKKVTRKRHDASIMAMLGHSMKPEVRRRLFAKNVPAKNGSVPWHYQNCPSFGNL